MPEEASAPIRRLKMTLKRAKREALEDLFGLWLRDYAPQHFTRQAFGRYEAYSDSAKRNMAEWLRRHKDDIRRGLKKEDAHPAKESGKLEKAFLHGTQVFSGGMERLSVRWLGLPKYATMRNRYSGFELSKALVDVSESELMELKEHFDGLLQKALDKTEFRGKSYGRRPA